MNLYLNVIETCRVRKENQRKGDFTIMNKLNISVTKIYYIRRITWQQFMHCCCLKWLGFRSFMAAHFADLKVLLSSARHLREF
jgi:hypothetical protein